MHLEWYHYILMLLAGASAGVVNTLAGSGSVFTLSVLIFAGLPVDIANGTNRIGTSVQSLIATNTFYRNGRLPFTASLKYTLPTLIGALIGAITVAKTDRDNLEIIIGIIMIFLLLLTIFKPQQYFKAKTLSGSYPWLERIIFLAIGFYGGFIQAGIGIFLLVALNTLSSFDMLQANAVKILTVMLFSLPVLLIFIYNKQVNWILGGWVAVGQALGSSIAAKFAVRSSNAGTWMKFLLIGMMLITILKVFGFFELFLS
ncbi:MAG: sulfite exporter TauE/SafE family protein [Bacteroidota bacterium]